MHRAKIELDVLESVEFLASADGAQSGSRLSRRNRCADPAEEDLLVPDDIGPFHNLSMNGRHIHHFVWGIILLLTGEKASKQ